MNMKLSFSTRNVPRGTFLDLCRQASDYGFSGFELYDALHERRAHSDSILRNEKFDRIAVCGPKPMMMAMASYAKSVGTPCEVSLENTMACGLGACLCCVEDTAEGNVCVCKEGPVFDIKKLKWQI